MSGKIEEYQVNDVNDLITQLPKPITYRMRWVYRGQVSAEWKLVPGLFRLPDKLFYLGTDDSLEEILMQRFQRQARPFLIPTLVPQDQLEWIALAQHHHLPTRLLDWTESPLTALFFAVDDPMKSYIDKDGVLWSLIAFPFPKTSQFTSYEEIDKSTVGRPNNLYFPHHLDSRISAQQGCFTVHIKHKDEPFISLEEQAALGEKSLVLQKFIIPANKKEEIRYELNEIGINHFTLFPDLDGLSRKLMWDIRNYRESI